MSRRKVGRKLDLIITADGGAWERERQSGEPQAKQGAPLKHDWIAITTEAAFREATATKKQRTRASLLKPKACVCGAGDTCINGRQSPTCARLSKRCAGDFVSLIDFPAIPTIPTKNQARKAAVSSDIQRRARWATQKSLAESREIAVRRLMRLPSKNSATLTGFPEPTITI
jgi:hypothetical protein